MNNKFLIGCQVFIINDEVCKRISYLKTLLETKLNVDKIECENESDKYIIIDRDPIMFTKILNSARFNETLYTNNYKLVNEVKFYGYDNYKQTKIVKIKYSTINCSYTTGKSNERFIELFEKVYLNKNDFQIICKFYEIIKNKIPYRLEIKFVDIGEVKEYVFKKNVSVQMRISIAERITLNKINSAINKYKYDFF